MTARRAERACLFDDGKIAEGEVWRQESIVGSVFEGTLRVSDGALLPTIRGNAFVNAEATLLLNPDDPYCWGIG
jgi:4-hydroxyproline epimerase